MPKAKTAEVKKPPRKKTAWQQHLSDYKAKNPDTSLKECMKEAAKTYTKPTD